MLIQDPQGKYTIKVDTTRNIVSEAQTGLWNKEDMKRFNSDFVNKIGPALKGKKWARLSNLRGYKPSDITEEIKEHVDWAEKNGLSCAAIVVESAIVKMQMGRSAIGSVKPKIFLDENEADAWLKSQGY